MSANTHLVYITGEFFGHALRQGGDDSALPLLDTEGDLLQQIVKEVRDLTDRVKAMVTEEQQDEADAVNLATLPKDELHRLIKELEREMQAAAKALEFEKAAILRDQILDLRGALADKEPEGNLLLG